MNSRFATGLTKEKELYARLGCIFLPESSGFLYFPFLSPVFDRNLNFCSAVTLFFRTKRSKNLRSKTKRSLNHLPYTLASLWLARMHHNRSSQHTTGKEAAAAKPCASSSSSSTAAAAKPGTSSNSNSISSRATRYDALLELDGRRLHHRKGNCLALLLVPYFPAKRVCWTEKHDHE